MSITTQFLKTAKNKNSFLDKKRVFINYSLLICQAITLDGISTVSFKARPVAEVSQGHFPPPLWIRIKNILFVNLLNHNTKEYELSIYLT